MPDFALEGSPLLVLARALTVAASFSLFGALTFRWLVMLGGAALDDDRAWLRISWVSACVGWIGLLVWLVLQSADMADATTIREAFAAIPDVVLRTRFGHVLAARLALMAIVPMIAGLGMSRPRLLWATFLAGAAVALEAANGHALAARSGWLTLAAVAHLLAVGAWIGGLMPLLLYVRKAPPEKVAAALGRFSPLGIVCVSVLAVSAVAQSQALVGGLPGLFGTAYGWIILSKLLLFAILLGLAAINRLILTPRFSRASAEHPRRALQRSVTAEIFLGLLAITAASFLSEFPPGAHLQPLWPFPFRPGAPSFADPELRSGILIGVLMLGGALILLGAGLAFRRFRWAVIPAAILAPMAIPSLRYIFVEAYPTSYFTSPTGFSAPSIANGAILFSENCAGCHGAEGRGDGPSAASLPIRPADLTAAHVMEHPDGDLFWRLSEGFVTPGGSPAMPAFRPLLSPEDLWSLVDFVHALNAASTIREAGLKDTKSWTRPTPAPDLIAACSQGKTAIRLTDLRGKLVLIDVISDDDPRAVAPPSQAAGMEIVTILMSRSVLVPPAGACAVADPLAWQAYAIIGGIPPGTLTGTRFVVDEDGWLRFRWDPGDRPDWSEPSFIAEIAHRVTASPVQAIRPSGHIHHPA